MCEYGSEIQWTSHWRRGVFYLVLDIGLYNRGYCRCDEVLTGSILPLLPMSVIYRSLASLVSFRFVLEQWVNQSSYIHLSLQFALIYEQQITQLDLSLICHLSLRCTGEVFSCYKQTPSDPSMLVLCCGAQWKKEKRTASLLITHKWKVCRPVHLP